MHRRHEVNLNLPESVAEYFPGGRLNIGERNGDRAADKFRCLDHDRLCNREGRAVNEFRELGE
jgi:hypothetical protein